MRYTRTQTVEAIQWTGSNNGDILRWQEELGFTRPSIVICDDPDDGGLHMILLYTESSIRLYPGDYLVVNEHNVIDGLDKESFEKDFRECIEPLIVTPPSDFDIEAFKENWKKLCKLEPVVKRKGYSNETS